MYILSEWKETIPLSEDQKLIKELRALIKEKDKKIEELSKKLKELSWVDEVLTNGLQKLWLKPKSR